LCSHTAVSFPFSTICILFYIIFQPFAREKRNFGEREGKRILFFCEGSATKEKKPSKKDRGAIVDFQAGTGGTLRVRALSRILRREKKTGFG